MSPAPPPPELSGLAAAQEALASGAHDARSLTELALRRAEQIAPLHAFTAVQTDTALMRAAALDAAGTPPGQRGPLWGVPVVLKDNVAQAGVANRAGSRVLPDVPEHADALVTARLEAAGAVIIGRTNMHELAWGGTTDNPHHGACRNPWDLERISAGSSGGTASAVAAGAVPLGVGTDTGGSVRLPSAVTNLTGLRPSIGRISTEGVVTLSWTLDTVGPMARSARDARAMFDLLADRPAPPRPHPPAALPGLVVGVLADYTFEAVQPGVAEATRRMLDTLRAEGAVVREVGLPDLDLMVDALIVVDAVEPSAIYGGLARERPALLGADVRAQLLAGLEFSAVDYVQAQRFRTHLSRHLAGVWEKVDLLLMPTLPFTAPRVGQRTVRLGERDVDNLRANVRFTSLPSLTGTPALSLPAGFDGDGLPIGVQLVAASGRDEWLLDVAIDLQDITDHHRHQSAVI